MPLDRSPMSTPQLKKQMVEALNKSLGVIATACRAVGIDRKTHYEWLKKDEKYAEQVKELKEIALDFAESQLFKNIKEGKETSLIFYLKTQGRDRGYIERKEILMDEDSKLTLNVKFNK